MTRSREPRFCVVGAGAAGIAAADALRRHGHRQITIFERHPQRIGGKCRTVAVNGVPVDTGAIFVLPNYPIVEALCRRVGVTLQLASQFVHLGPDGRIRPLGTPPRPISLLAKAAEYGRLGAELLKYRRLLGCPLGQVDPALVRALALPLGRWIDAHRLEHFREVAYPLLRSFGFGFEEQEVPAAYVINMFPQLARRGNLVALWNVGGIELHRIQEGYGELWRRLAAGMDIRLGAEIQAIERTGGVVRVRTASGSFEFDHLILACPLDDALAFLDDSPEERRLLSRVRWLAVWQATVRLEGLPGAALLDQNQAFSRIGRPMSLFHHATGSNLYYVFGYTTPTMPDEAVAAAITEDLTAMGGRLLGALALKRWRYFPHYASDDLAAGCPSALERLQGQRDTWYVGELLANIGVESVASYSARLVERTWGGAR